MASLLQYLKSNIDISEETFLQLSIHTEVKQYAKKEKVLQLGEVCQYTFFVEFGLLRAYTLDNFGKEHIIQFAPEHWFITDRSSLFFNEPSNLIIEAIEDTEVIVLNTEFMDKLSCLSNENRQFNERLLHRHIFNLQNRINELLAATAEERYLNFIKLYPDLLQRVPQWMVASYLGITPESLSRVRKDIVSKAKSKI